jgi:hypothetical protein
MAKDNEIPAAPAYLSESAAKQWRDTYGKALDQAKIGSPDNERAQRVTATKAANAMLAVPAPQSAADILALAPWQTLKLETKDGVVSCVTTDGRKYSFPEGSGKKTKGDK